MTQELDRTGLGPSAGQASPTLIYVGKYKLSIEMSTGIFYLKGTAQLILDFSTAIEEALVFALYTVAGTSPVRCALQFAPVDTTPPVGAGAYLNLGIQPDEFAIGVLLGSYPQHYQFVYERQGDRVRLLTTDSKRVLVAHGEYPGKRIRLWVPEKESIFSVSWRLTAINEWRDGHMPGADLQHVDLRGRLLGPISLAGAT